MTTFPASNRNRPTMALALVWTACVSGLPGCGEAERGAKASRQAVNVAGAEERGNQSNPRVLPPASCPFGHSYGEWSARWWQYALGQPLSTSPFVDETGANFAVGQSGKVWFLAGKLCVTPPGCGSTAAATREVTLPAGRALFFPIANSERDNIGENPPHTDAELQALAKSDADSVLSMSCMVDGHRIEGLEDPLRTVYRVTAGPFSFVVPADNIYSLFGLTIPAGTIPSAAADGTFLMLAPLAVGRHTIHFAATFAGGFTLDITYHLRVVPGEP